MYIYIYMRRTIINRRLKASTQQCNIKIDKNTRLLHIKYITT
jgi:hypothetical protein